MDHNLDFDQADAAVESVGVIPTVQVSIPVKQTNKSHQYSRRRAGTKFTSSKASKTATEKGALTAQFLIHDLQSANNRISPFLANCRINHNNTKKSRHKHAGSKQARIRVAHETSKSRHSNNSSFSRLQERDPVAEDDSSKVISSHDIIQEHAGEKKP